jgi:formylglycine-generating enzyme required for sulfatase activity
MFADAQALASIPAGRLELRDARTRSLRQVELAAFELGVVPVTAAEFGGWAGTVAGAGGITAGDAAASTAAGINAGPGASSAAAARPAHPVTWFDAVRWCNAASEQAGLQPAYEVGGRRVRWDVAADGFRLPTEAEWEWACRAGTTTPTYGPLAEIAWTAADGLDGPQDVGGKAPNAFGLYDTIGNVWEWCWDYADTARYADYRSLRGGGWADREWSCRASVRRGSAPDAVLEDVGFRVARGAAGAGGTEPGATGANTDAAQGW